MIEMPRCIFCDAVLTPQTKPEHILLDAFGGRKKVRTVDCSECNGGFGQTIDVQLANQTLHLRNLLRLPNGTSGVAPTLKGIKAGRITINMAGDGKMTVVDKPFTVTKINDDAFNVELRLNDIDDIEKYLPHISAQTGIPVERLRDQLGPSEIVMVEQRPDVDPYNLRFGGEGAIRGAAKACLVLWATLVGNDEIKQDNYLAARDYVLKGDEEFTATRTHIDVRHLPQAAELAQTYSPIFNLIYVGSDAQGRVVGHYTLNNIIAFQVVLAESGGSPDKRIALISNPTEPKVWSDRAAEVVNLPLDWLDQPDSDTFSTTTERLSNLMRFYFETNQPIERERIYDDVVKSLGLRPDTPISPDMVERLKSLYYYRVALHEMGLPYEQKMTFDQWQEARKNGTQEPD